MVLAHFLILYDFPLDLQRKMTARILALQNLKVYMTSVANRSPYDLSSPHYCTNIHLQLVRVRALSNLTTHRLFKLVARFKTDQKPFYHHLPVR